MIKIEQPPDSLPKDAQDYLLRMFKIIDSEFKKDRLMPRNEKFVSELYKEGTLRYFPNAVSGSPITTGGLWWYDGSWTKIV